MSTVRYTACVDGRDNPPDDLLGQPDRDGLAISVALRLGDRPTARRDRLSARFDNGFGAARVPRVVEQQGGSLHVKPGETRSIFCLVHFILRYRTVAVEPEKTRTRQGALPGSLATCRRSWGKLSECERDAETPMVSDRRLV